MTKPYELLVRMPHRSSPGGASVRYITTVGDRDYEGDPQPLSGTSDPAFAAFADQFSAKTLAERDEALAERDAARAERDTLRTERDAAIAERDAAIAERDALRTELEALRNPKDASGFPVLSAVQLREGMVEAGIYDKVQDAIKTIPDDRERLRFNHYFEYSTQFHRDHPMIAAMASAVGLSDTDVDTFWRAAGVL